VTNKVLESGIYFKYSVFDFCVCAPGKFLCVIVFILVVFIYFYMLYKLVLGLGEGRREGEGLCSVQVNSEL